MRSHCCALASGAAAEKRMDPRASPPTPTSLPTPPQTATVESAPMTPRWWNVWQQSSHAAHVSGELPHCGHSPTTPPTLWSSRLSGLHHRRAPFTVPREKCQHGTKRRTAESPSQSPRPTTGFVFFTDSAAKQGVQECQ